MNPSEDTARQSSGQPVIVDADGLPALFDALRGRGSTVGGPAVRDGAFVIAVECTEPGATCFCTSMGCGPGAESGFDLAMTELTDVGSHRFVVRAGTAAGADVLADVPSRPADEATVRHAVTAVDEAAERMGRTMPV